MSQHELRHAANMQSAGISGFTAVLICNGNQAAGAQISSLLSGQVTLDEIRKRTDGLLCLYAVTAWNTTFEQLQAELKGIFSMTPEQLVQFVRERTQAQHARLNGLCCK